MAARQRSNNRRPRSMRIRLLYDLHGIDQVRGGMGPHTDVYILPELVDGGYAALFRGKGVHREGDPTIESIRLASRRLSATVIAGSLVIRSPRGTRKNTSLVFCDGKRVHRYDKMHLFHPTGEERLFGGGEKARTFPLRIGRGGITAAVILCYDLRFPELTRLLARAGARILFVPARWPKVRDAAWRTLLRARAIENQIFVIGCNGRGKEGGYSYAVDPLGVEIFSSRQQGARTGTIVCDLSRLDEARRHHDNLGEALPLVLERGEVRRLREKRKKGRKRGQGR